MVPVATLPAAAILMGVGYWIDPVGWGGDNALAAFFIKSGSAIIDNMSVLFAIGVAYGMSKDKDGAAALTGFVGFLVLTTLCSPAAVSMIQKIPLDQVPAAFGKIQNQFVGRAAQGAVVLQRPPFGADPHFLPDDPGGFHPDVHLAGDLQRSGELR